MINTPRTIFASPEAAPEFGDILTRGNVPVFASGEQASGQWRFILSEEAFDLLQGTEDGQRVLELVRSGQLTPAAAEEYADIHTPVVTWRPGLPLVGAAAILAVGFASAMGLVTLGPLLVPIALVGIGFAVLWIASQTTKEARQMYRAADWAASHHSDPGTRQAAKRLRPVPILLLILLLLFVFGFIGGYVSLILSVGG